MFVQNFGRYPRRGNVFGVSEGGATSLRGALLSAEARLRAKADATKQSILSFRRTMDCFAYARNDGWAVRK
jgi:hypothetical protein